MHVFLHRISEKVRDGGLVRMGPPNRKPPTSYSLLNFHIKSLG